MKKLIVMGVLIFFVVGCQSKKNEETKFRGVMYGKQDYAAQGVAYLKKSDIENAIKSFDEAIKHDPRNLENYFTLGQVYMHLSAYPKAAEIFAVAVSVDPSSGEAFYLLAVNLALAGNRSAAAKAVEQSIAIFSKKKDEDKLKQSLVFLQGLSNSEVPGKNGNPAGKVLENDSAVIPVQVPR